MTARTLCCNKPMMGLGGDPTRIVVSWNPYNGVIQCHACGSIYVDSKDPKDYDRWCDAGGGMEQDRAPRAPAPCDPARDHEAKLGKAEKLLRELAHNPCEHPSRAEGGDCFHWCLPCRARAFWRDNEN